MTPSLDPELDVFLAEWAKKPGPDMSEVKELSTTFRLWVWQVRALREKLCRMVDAKFAPDQLLCTFSEKDHAWWGLAVELTVVVKGERRRTVEFDMRLKRMMFGGPDVYKTDYWDKHEY